MSRRARPVLLPHPTNRRHWVALGIIVPTLTMLLLIGGLFQWSPHNCWHEDVDINTGRIRHTRYLLFCQIGDRTEDTWLSHASSKSNGPPDWRRVNTFSPGVRQSPHYRFHGAIHQISALERADSMVTFDSLARRQVAETLLKFWQTSASCDDADEYVEKVANIACALHNDGVLVFAASDVPAH